MSDVSVVAAGSSWLKTIAPGTPTPLRSRSSSVMLFSRKETSGMSQKLVIMACSSTTLARLSAASPVMSLKLTLHISRAHTNNAKAHSKEMGRRYQAATGKVFAFLSAGADKKANTLVWFEY